MGKGDGRERPLHRDRLLVLYFIVTMCPFVLQGVFGGSMCFPRLSLFLFLIVHAIKYDV